MLESPPDEGQETQKVEEAARREGQVQLVTGQHQGQQEHQTEVQLQIVYQKLHGVIVDSIYGCYHTHEAPVKERPCRGR